MNNRTTINDVVRYGEPNPRTQFENKQFQFIMGGDAQPAKPADPLTIAELTAENERLKTVINTWKQKKPVIREEVVEEGAIPEEFNKRIAYNQQKIKDLKNQISEQEEVITAYQQKFGELEDNLNNLMKLDKDIHSKLVNPNQSGTLQKNVKSVMLALNSGAASADVIRMIESIKV